MTHVLRFVVIQAILAAMIVAAWLIGWARIPFAGDSAYLCIFVLAVFGVGLYAVLRENYEDAQWIASQILRLGLLGTVVGLIIAFSAASAVTPDAEATRAMVARTVDGMFVALFVTLFGLAANLWLKLNLRLLGGIR